MKSKLTVRLVTDTKEFESLRDVWDRLLEKSCDKNIYLTWEWIFTWWRHYGNRKNLNILLIEDESRIVGIIPLMFSRFGKSFIKFDVLKIIGIANADFDGVILTERKEECILSFIEYLTKVIDNRTVLIFSEIPEDAEFLALMRSHYPTFSKSLIMNESVSTTCPYILLPTTWNEYFKSLRGKRRHNLRYALRSLQKKHAVEFRKFIANNNSGGQIEEFIELHQKRWRKKNIKGIFHDQRTRKFYIDVANVFSKKKWLNLSFIDVDGKAISAVYGFRYSQKFYYEITAFDTEYAKYSMGNLHIMFLIEDAIKNGDKEFDFLMGDEAYKRYYTRLSRRNFQIILTKKRFPANWWPRLLPIIMRLNSICRHSLLGRL